MEKKEKAVLVLGIAALCAAAAILVCLGVFYVKYWGFHAGMEEVFPWAVAAAVCWVPFLVCLIARLILILKIRKEQRR